MGRTALELSKEWQTYRPGSRIVEEPHHDRLDRAWDLARTATGLHCDVSASAKELLRERSLVAAGGSNPERMPLTRLGLRLGTT